MDKSWLKEILEENRKEVDLWPDWKKATDPSKSEDKQSAKTVGDTRKKVET